MTTQEHALLTQKTADQKFCFFCGDAIHGSAPTCPKCGAIQPKMMSVQNELMTIPTAQDNHGTEVLRANHAYCRGCGHQIHSQAITCPKCGAPQHANPGVLSGSRKDRVGAALLAFFLGGFGGHKFYLGHVGTGILYLLFFWTFIPAFLALIEGIIYLTMSEQEFSRKYNGS